MLVLTVDNCGRVTHLEADAPGEQVRSHRVTFSGALETHTFSRRVVTQDAEGWVVDYAPGREPARSRGYATPWLVLYVEEGATPVQLREAFGILLDTSPGVHGEAKCRCCPCAPAEKLIHDMPPREALPIIWWREEQGTWRIPVPERDQTWEHCRRLLARELAVECLGDAAVAHLAPLFLLGGQFQRGFP